MVMGDDSCLRGRGFEPQRCILDGHFSHCNVCLKRPKINKKRPGMAFLNISNKEHVNAT